MTPEKDNELQSSPRPVFLSQLIVAGADKNPWCGLHTGPTAPASPEEPEKF